MTEKSTQSKLRVIVSEPRIEAAIRCDGHRCMIADAIKDAAKQINWKIGYVRVDMATIRFTDPLTGQRYIWLTPKHAAAALLLFDAGKKPLPFKIMLRRNDATQIQKVGKRQPPQIKLRTSTPRTEGGRRRGGKRIDKITVIGGPSLPHMPRQTTRVFGMCGLKPELVRQLAEGFTS